LTLARQFKRVFEEYSGRLWSDNKLIVDWGCGSGRVARHIIKELKQDQHFVGFDIDKSATDWANENIAPFFKQSKMDPPLKIDSGAVDVLLAYSVLTHLALEDMRKWIKEAARVIKKDGYFIFTILSDTALIDLMPYAETGMISKFCKTGIFDTNENSQLESMGVSGDYYRNVWLHKEFIKTEMQEFFEVVALERNFHYYQDVVVCKRK
jgi:SAM-dependent methyltransferase